MSKNNWCLIVNMSKSNHTFSSLKMNILNCSSLLHLSAGENGNCQNSTSFQIKHNIFLTFCLERNFKGIVINRTFYSRNGRSMEFISVDPFKPKYWIFSSIQINPTQLLPLSAAERNVCISGIVLLATHSRSIVQVRAGAKRRGNRGQGQEGVTEVVLQFVFGFCFFIRFYSHLF